MIHFRIREVRNPAKTWYVAEYRRWGIFWRAAETDLFGSGRTCDSFEAAWKACERAAPWLVPPTVTVTKLVYDPATGELKAPLE